MAQVIRHYKVYVRHMMGSEFLAGVTGDGALTVTDGFLLLEHPENHCRIGINATEVAMYRLEAEYSEHATKNT